MCEIMFEYTVKTLLEINFLASRKSWMVIIRQLVKVDHVIECLTIGTPPPPHWSKSLVWTLGCDYVKWDT